MTSSGISISIIELRFRRLLQFHIAFIGRQTPNGLRYLRWGGDGEAVQPEKCSGVENCLGCAQNPQRQVHALLGCGFASVIYELGGINPNQAIRLLLLVVFPLRPSMYTRLAW